MYDRTLKMFYGVAVRVKFVANALLTFYWAVMMMRAILYDFALERTGSSNHPWLIRPTDQWRVT